MIKQLKIILYIIWDLIPNLISNKSYAANIQFYGKLDVSCR